MQKLVTVCLSGYNLKHGAIEEHLSGYLSEGWRIVSVTGAGGSAGNGVATVWFAVLLDLPSNSSSPAPNPPKA